MSKFLACLILVTVAQSAYGDIQIQSFDAEIALIEYRIMEGAGRDELIDAFSKFLVRNPEHRRRAEIMFRLGALNEQTPKGKKPNREAALEWYRKAMEASRPGSKMWVDALMMQIPRLRDAERFEDAEKLAHNLKKYCKDMLNQARANNALQSLAIRQNNLLLAAQYCREIQEIDFAAAPLAARWELDSIQQGSSDSMHRALRGSKLPVAKILLAEFPKPVQMLRGEGMSKVVVVSEAKPGTESGWVETKGTWVVQPAK